MGSRKRKPLSDITDILKDHNLTPFADLRDRFASKPIFKPNSSSKSYKVAPESSDRSNTSIGSSSVGAAFSPKTVQFRHPSPALSPTTSPTPGDTGIKALVSSLGRLRNRRQNVEKSKKEKEAYGVASCKPVEQRKDKGKAIVVPFRSSASEKMKDPHNKICNLALTDSGMGSQSATNDTRQNTEKLRKERESDGIACGTSMMKALDKGKAVAVPYSLSSTGKLKNTQNDVRHTSTLVEISFHKDMGDIDFSSGSVEKVKETKKDMSASCSYSAGKTDKGKANLLFSDHALRKKSEMVKNIADTSCRSPEKIQFEKKGILKCTRSSIHQIKGDDYLNPSSSLVEGAKGRAKSVNIFNSLPEKTRGKEKVILKPSNMRESSTAVTAKSWPSKKTSEKNKSAVGISSCPPMTRTQNKMNDLDKDGDVKYSKSGTDAQANGKKKRCWRSEDTIELPEDFIKEQKAYYDDVDNFELPVEEASGDELD